MVADRTVVFASERISERTSTSVFFFLRSLQQHAEANRARSMLRRAFRDYDHWDVSDGMRRINELSASERNGEDTLKKILARCLAQNSHQLYI